MIAEDQVLLREGLRLGSSRMPDTTWSGRSTTRTTARRRGQRARPDLAIVDVRMPPLVHRRRHPRSTMDPRRAPGHRGARPLAARQSTGAVGLVHRAASAPPQLTEARCFGVPRPPNESRGGSALDPEVVASLVGGSGTPRFPRTLIANAKCSRLMAEGLTNNAIARRLTLTERTVEGQATKR